MGSYVVHFVVYTLAMSGLICLALFVYKKIMTGSICSKSGTKILEVEETMSINPRKSLMVVKAGTERFLIASDVDKTTLISKLEQNNIPFLKMGANIASHPLEISDAHVNIEKSKEKNIDIAANEIANLTKLDIKNPKVTPPINSSQKPKRKKQVHLEVIHDLNPKVVSRNGKKVSNITKHRERKVNINVGEVKNHGLSTIKEMVAKVNEI